ncbi:hypothetical protein ANO11243_022040 [Dothideomycetidae sp. 11243]|nr:hypothetical protein ANO11243_022040 [fungal sp. No.11243]
MADRRPLSSFTSGDFDHPPATITLAEHSLTRLDRLGQALERQREETRNLAEAARHERWMGLSGLRRRRGLRNMGVVHSPTYEGRGLARTEESHDDIEDRPRHAKRRKLDSSFSVYDRSYKYGHYGQVEPGRLKLDLCSCDGGTHQDRTSPYYGPANILKHDKSVYSSQSPHCNIILRHHDSTAFTLEKLIVIAPEDGFTAPVKYGTVSVAMGYEDLMPLAADAILDNDAQSSAPENDDEEQNGVFETLDQPEVFSAEGTPAHDRRSDLLLPPLSTDPIPQPLPSANNFRTRDGRIWAVESIWPPLEPSTRISFARADPQQPVTIEEFSLDSGIRVTMDYDHEIGWPEEPTAGPILDDRLRRNSVARRQALLDTIDSDAWDPRYRSTLSRLRRGPQAGLRQTHGNGIQSGNLNKACSKDVTRVRFEIKDEMASVAIKFDPPVYDKL